MQKLTYFVRDDGSRNHVSEATNTWIDVFCKSRAKLYLIATMLVVITGIDDHFFLVEVHMHRSFSLEWLRLFHRRVYDGGNSPVVSSVELRQVLKKNKK